MSCRIFVVAALVACLAAVARGQDKPAPDDEPTGCQAPANPAASDEAADESAKLAEPEMAPKPGTPKAARADEAALRGALKTLARSLQEGKADGIKQVVYAANPTERKMVDAMAAMAVQIAGLHKASAKAFGEAAARTLTGDVAAEMSRIDDAEVSIDGDTATVRYRAPDAPAAPAASPDGEPAAPADAEDSPDGPPAAMVLARVDGRWRVPMSELSKDATPEGIEQRLADLEVQTRVIGDLTKDIAKGKYRGADQAAEAWHARMMQALTPGKPSPVGERPAGDKPTGNKASGADGEKSGQKSGGEAGAGGEAGRADDDAPDAETPRELGKE